MLVSTYNIETMPVGGKKRNSKKTPRKSSRNSSKFSRSRHSSKKTSRSISKRPYRTSFDRRSPSEDRVEGLSSAPKVVDDTMSLSYLQRIARTRGVPFGGLTKQQLIRKINTY